MYGYTVVLNTKLFVLFQNFFSFVTTLPFFNLPKLTSLGA